MTGAADVFALLILAAVLMLIGIIFALTEGEGWVGRFNAWVYGVLSDRPRAPAVSALRSAEHAGATIEWSPEAEILGTFEPEAEEHAAVELARQERKAEEQAVADLLAEFHAGLARAWRDFDVAMLAPMSTASRWHIAGTQCGVRCPVCAEAYFVKPDGHTGLRAFREDTPTGEFKIITAAHAATT